MGILKTLTTSWNGWAVAIAVLVLGLIYMALDTSASAERVGGERKGFLYRLVHRMYKYGGLYPFIWAILAFFANRTSWNAWIRLLCLLVLVGWVCYEAVDEAATFFEHACLAGIIIVLWYVMCSIASACLGSMAKLSGRFIFQIVDAMPELLTTAAITIIAADWVYYHYKNTEPRDKRFKDVAPDLWKVVALIGALIFLYILLFLKLKPWLNAKENTNKDIDTTVTVTETPTPTQYLEVVTPTPTPDPDPEPTEVEEILSLSEQELDFVLAKYGLVDAKICKNSLPSRWEDRKFEEAISTPFSETTAFNMKEELYTELKNPVWLYARFDYLREVQPDYGCFRRYVELYDENGLEYFLEPDGETLTREYLRYAAIGGLFLEKTKVSLATVDGTEFVWRLNSGEIWKEIETEEEPEWKLDIIPKKRKYSEAKEYRDVLVIWHITKDGKGYYEYINVLDKAPVIPKDKPKPTPSPTPKPNTPTPKPNTPTPKPNTPTPKPPSPTPKPNTPTPVPPSPTPTNKPKDPTQGTKTNTEKNDTPDPGEFTGITATPTPAGSTPTQTPAKSPTPSPTPASSKEQPTNSSNQSSYEDYKKSIEQNKPEPTTPVTPVPTEVPDCDNPGKKKIKTGNIDDNSNGYKVPPDEPKTSGTPTPVPAPIDDQTEYSEAVDANGNPLKDNSDPNNRQTSTWGGSGR